MIQIDQISVSLGGRPVLTDISLSLPPGGICALVGANGSGKSTLLNAIFGVVPLTSGVIRLAAGADAQTRPTPDWALASGVAFVSQEAAVFPTLSVRENIEIGCLSKSRSERQRAVRQSLELFPKLAAMGEVHAGLLSGGEQQMTAICRALVASPRLLLLDEPLCGLAPSVAVTLLQNLRDIALATRVSVLVVEHNIREILSVADMLVGLRDGRIAIGPEAVSTLSMDKLLPAIFGPLVSG